MTLRAKTLLVIGITFLIMLGLLYAATSSVLMDSFKKLENDYVLQNVNQARSALEDDLTTLVNTARDYAAWDKTYAFMEGRNKDYLAEEYPDESLAGIRINLVFILDPKGKILFSKAMDLQTESEIKMPEKVNRYLAGAKSSLLQTQADKSKSGIALLPDSPLLLSAQPILTSKRQGPARGTLIMGRYLDAQEIHRLSEIAHLPISIRAVDEIHEQKASRFDIVRSALGESSAYILPINGNTIAGYLPVKDLGAAPAFALKIEVPRKIFQQGLLTLYYLMGSVLGISFIFAAVVSLFVERTVLTRLSFLSSSVDLIGREQDLSRRIEAAGKDELARLTSNINQMLEKLESSRNQLQMSEERYRDLFHNASDMVYTHDMNGNFTSTNTAALSVVGYLPEELPKMNIAQLVVPEHHERIKAMIEKKLKEGGITTYEIDILTKDGTRRSLEVSSRLVFQQKKPVEIHGIARDITARKELEKKTQELERLKDDLTRMLVHDFKGPMTVLKGFLQLLEKKETEKPEIIRWIGIMQASVYNLSQMISNLLDISRLENASMKFANENFNINQTLEAALSEMDFIAKGKGVSLHYQPVIPELRITGDSLAITRILTNIVGNAIKHTPSGKNIFVKTESFEGAEPSTDGIKISVSDEGEGIAPENLDKVFDKFWTTTTAGKGTGLGLSFCKMAVEAQGGKIWAESVVGKGSTFTFSIPAAKEVVQE